MHMSKYKSQIIFFENSSSRGYWLLDGMHCCLWILRDGNASKNVSYGRSLQWGFTAPLGFDILVLSLLQAKPFCLVYICNATCFNQVPCFPWSSFHYLALSNPRVWSLIKKKMTCKKHGLGIFGSTKKLHDSFKSRGAVSFLSFQMHSRILGAPN